MSIRICLDIDDAGAMTVSQETKEAEAATEGLEGETTGQPVKNIQQALQVIQQFAEAASMQAPEAQQEEQAMTESFSQR